MIPEIKARIRATIKLWTVIVSIVFCTVVFQVWVLAFINGDSVVVYINLFGEKTSELILWIIAFPILTYGLVSLLRQQLRECRTARRRWNR
jgi:hypothetical protein